MTFEQIRSVLAWSGLINIGLLLYWYLMIALARDWVFKIHTKFFPMSEEDFSRIHYTGMMYFKVAVFGFIIIPYLAMRIVG